MSRFKSTKLLVLVMAVLSLSGSAIAACMCSHHTPAANTASLSCHGGSDEAGHKPADAEPRHETGHSIEVSCDCFVRTPVVAITAKSETKKSDTSDVDNDSAAAADAFDLRVLQTLTSSGDLYRSPLYRSDHPRPSGPSRAPPRL
ncbi:MAG: hypothetical protein H0V76_07375 [Blastocatellia bacterium]|nr:hypothetical protein [Blastocatellia bacterium]